ncbi:integrator complex assembly factor BRAT1 [Gastrophryne carolinensis]
MDTECSQLLPHVCKILVDNRSFMTDDSSYEKLLDWFQSLLLAAPPEVILEENPCIVGLLQQVLNVEEPDPSVLAFSMRVVGIFSSRQEGFEYLQVNNVMQNIFGEDSFNSVAWKDASVRRAWIQGLLCMLNHKQALNYFHHGGLMNVMLNLLMDSSLFVASAVTGLVAHLFHISVALNGQPGSRSVSDLPNTAQTIFTHLAKSLFSGASVDQSLKALTAIFRDSTDSLAAVLWPQTAEMVSSLLNGKHANETLHLENLLLTVTRFPLFCSSEHGVWIVIKRALRELNPLQAASLAFGILKLKQTSALLVTIRRSVWWRQWAADFGSKMLLTSLPLVLSTIFFSSPQDIRLQSACVLFHPLDYVLRISAENSGLFDEPVCNPASVESLLSIKSSCTGLLCQCLAHLTELCNMDALPTQIPHGSVLCSVVLVLQYCNGQSVCTSPVGSLCSRFLIGSLRVQRSALDAIGALSVWPWRLEDSEKTYSLLALYIENPETDPTVLKKALQASLKWICSSKNGDEHREESQRFLQGLSPVVMKRLCSPCWEVRDSALEFLTNLTELIKGREDLLQILLSSSSLLQLVVDLFKDPESYVRASAVTCMGQIAILDLATTPTDLVSRLLDILCNDSESFPRRAVVKVFSDWLRKGHMVSLYDGKPLLSRILEITLADLDWEVKVNALELVHVYLTQTLNLPTRYSCPYTAALPYSQSASSLADAVLECEQLHLFQFLLVCLCDCDRPVALKACEILLSVKPALCTGNGAVSDIYGREWLEHILQHHNPGITEQDTTWVTDILKKIDLDGMICSLSKSSDYLHETPLSLLQDISASLRGGEEQDADCY